MLGTAGNQCPSNKLVGIRGITLYGMFICPAYILSSRARTYIIKGQRPSKNNSSNGDAKMLSALFEMQGRSARTVPEHTFHSAFYYYQWCLVVSGLNQGSFLYPSMEDNRLFFPDRTTTSQPGPLRGRTSPLRPSSSVLPIRPLRSSSFIRFSSLISAL